MSVCPKQHQPALRFIETGRAAVFVSFVSLLLPLESRGQVLPEAADDLVEYTSLAVAGDSWSEPTIVQLRGSIREFDQDQLLLVEHDAAQRSISSQQIVWVEPNWSNEAAANAHRLFVSKQYRDVIATVPEVLKTGLARWQQRFLIAELVQSVDALGNPRAAGVFFLNLAQSKPPPLLYAAMPLCWSVREPSTALQAEAANWLASGDDVAQLLGASWLLSGPQRGEATRLLTRLQASENSAIAQLAVAQAWRLVPPPQTMMFLNQWIEFRDKLLPPLQLGPTELIADRLMRVGEAELAIGQWLRIASVHGQQYHRAAEALELATAQLKRLGRDEEAKRLESWIKELRGELPGD